MAYINYNIVDKIIATNTSNIRISTQVFHNSTQ